MYCINCRAQIDVKQKVCPKCNEKVFSKNRRKEYHLMKKYSKKHPKEVFGDPDIERLRTAEKYKAHFGRKKRTDYIRTTNEIFVLVAMILVLVIFSAGLYEKVSKKMNLQSREDFTGGKINDDGNIDPEKGTTATLTDAAGTEAWDNISDSKIVVDESIVSDNSPNDAGMILSEGDLDIISGQRIYELATDIIRNGKKKYQEGYKSQLLANKKKPIELSEDMLNENDGIDVYEYIWNTLGEDTMKIHFSKNNTGHFTIYIDEKNRVFIYAATKDNPMAYSVFPEWDTVYNTD